MTQLKADTQPLHTAAEQAVDIMGRLTSRDGYVDILQIFRASLVPYSRRLLASSAFQQVPDWSSRAIEDRLDDDLRALDVSEVPTLSSNVSEMSPAEALGAAYVIEGSSLGGVHIAKFVRQRLDESDAAATRYLTRYGDDVGRMWRSFGAHVDATLTSDEDVRAAVSAARAVFEQVIHTAASYDSTPATYAS